MLRQVLTLLIVFGCVSRTVPNQRFQASQALTAPTLAASSATEFSFAAVGDLHIAGGGTERLKTIVSQATAENDSFLVLLGDIVDTGVKSDFEAVHTSLAGFPTLFVIGNHDIFNDGWTSYALLNGPSHYSIEFASSRFIAIDTADGAVTQSEFDWLKKELENNKKENVFILSHYLPHIPGQRTYLRLSNEAEAVRLMKLASEHHVRAWLGAHYHSFLKGTVDGVDYVVAGGGGGRRMPPELRNFFVQVKVSGTNATYELKVVD